MFKEGVIPTEAKPGAPANAAVAFDGVGGAEWRDLVFPAAKQHKRFLDSRPSLARNDVHGGIQHLCNLLMHKRQRR